MTKLKKVVEVDDDDMDWTETTEIGSYDPNAHHPAKTYAGFYAAFDFFNRELFSGLLPACLITVQRHEGAYGYFSGNRFAKVGTLEALTDEIALNPAHFIRPVADVLSTLVHEMVHLQQHHFGKPGRGGYHNREWARMMRAIGLIPSETGKPGGKQTGDRVSHCIEEGGRFERACCSFIENNAAVLYQDRAYIKRYGGSSDGEQGCGGRRSLGDRARELARLRKAASKTTFDCSGCGKEKAWSKASAQLLCALCFSPMVAKPT